MRSRQSRWPVACALLLLAAPSCRRKPAAPQVTAEPYTAPTNPVTPGGTIDETVTTPFPEPLPFPVSPIIVGGFGHTCLLDTHGTASCFGDNYYGQLGDGTTTPHPIDPVRVKLDDLVQVGEGYHFSCGLRRDRSVWCWGSGSVSTIPGFGTHATPTRIEGVPPARQLSVGWGSVCALTETDVYCWGRSKFGQGDAPPVDLDSTPRAMGLGSPVAIGEMQVAGPPVLRASGYVEDPLASDRREVVISTPATRKSAQRVVALRGRATCAWMVLEDGSVHNDCGSDRGRQRVVMVMPRVRSLARDASPSCAVVVDGRVFCWASVPYDQALPDGGTAPLNVPEPVVGPTEATAVMGSFQRGCATDVQRRIWCWGSGYDGVNDPSASRHSAVPEVVATF